MKYVMFIVNDPDHSDDDEANAPDVEDWFAFARERGHYDLGVRLQDPPTATTVRVRGGKTITTDGPFAETKESIAGFALIEAASLEEAIELAVRNPSAHWGRIELREVHSFGGPIIGT